jgi:hypothetical protein
MNKMELMNFNYLLETEEMTHTETIKKLQEWFLKYPEFINVLFEAAYFTGKVANPESAEGSFHAYAHHLILRYPYTMRGVIKLLESGYYYESTFLIRNMFEVLVQLRYFSKHHNKFNQHVLGKRLRFRTMFDEIAPGFYETIYGIQLSEFAHGGFGSLIFRSNYSSPKDGTIFMGCKYDSNYCSYSFNLFFAAVSGILCFMPEFFPQYLSLAPKDVLNNRMIALKWLRIARRAHMKVNPKSEEYYKIIMPLIESTNNDQ